MGSNPLFKRLMWAAAQQRECERGAASQEGQRTRDVHTTAQGRSRAGRAVGSGAGPDAQATGMGVCVSLAFAARRLCDPLQTQLLVCQTNPDLPTVPPHRLRRRCSPKLRKGDVRMVNCARRICYDYFNLDLQARAYGPQHGVLPIFINQVLWYPRRLVPCHSSLHPQEQS